MFIQYFNKKLTRMSERKENRKGSKSRMESTNDANNTESTKINDNPNSTPRINHQGGTSTAQYITLPLNCDRWIKTTSQRTQIIYRADASIILYYMELEPTGRIVESGTGTLGLTYVLSRYLTEGTVDTVEYNKERYAEAKKEIAEIPLENVTIHNGKIKEYLEEAIKQKSKFNGLVLDVPDPEDVIEEGVEVLIPGSKIVCFIPCMEQVQRVLEKTEKTEKLKVERLLENVEIQHKPALLYTEEGTEYGTTPAERIRGHTGYILILQRKWEE